MKTYDHNTEASRLPTVPESVTVLFTEPGSAGWCQVSSLAYDEPFAVYEPTGEACEDCGAVVGYGLLTAYHRRYLCDDCNPLAREAIAGGKMAFCPDTGAILP